MGFGIVGVDFQGSLVLGDRLVHLPLLKRTLPRLLWPYPAIRILGQRIGPECLLAFINPGPLPTHHPEDQQQSGTKARLQPRFFRNDEIRQPGQPRSRQRQRSHAGQILEMIEDQGIDEK